VNYRFDRRHRTWHYVRHSSRLREILRLINVDAYEIAIYIVIEMDEDGYYIANVPSLPGCHTQAKSLDELKTRVQEAIQLYLEEIGPIHEKTFFVGVQQVEVS